MNISSENEIGLDPNETVPVFCSSDLDEALLMSLVLSAADIEHSLSQNEQQHWHVDTSHDSATRAKVEIAEYYRDNAIKPKAPSQHSQFHPQFRAMSLVVVSLLVLVYCMSGNWTPQSSWFIAAAGDSGRIFENHEYYRLITPLFLHADATHLLNNCILGGLLLHYYFQLTGNGFGISILLCSSALAHLCNCLIHGPGHHFVGFSTAVFVCAGFLSSYQYQRFSSYGKLRRLFPIMAASALLALLGSEGERTDLGAHLFGLFTGLISGYGFSVARMDYLRTVISLQLLSGTVTLALLSWAWFSVPFD